MPEDLPGTAGRPPIPKLVSVVVPLYNEEAIVDPLLDRILQVVRAIGAPFEIIAVDDGSRDGTRGKLIERARLEPGLTVVCLTRNFGLQGAVSAGLAQAQGDVVVLMDGDLQDPPELIPRLLDEWRGGADIVFTTKRTRAESGLRRFAFDGFHFLLKRLGQIELPLGAGNFSLIDGHALAAINRLPEHNRYLPGLRAWVGFRQVEVAFDRQERAAGEPRMSYRRLVKLALDGIFGFSFLPLRAATYLGFLVTLFGLFLVGWVLVERFVTRTAILGWPSLMVAVCILGGTQLVTIGILGEYLGRIYDEVRGRPNYLVHELIRFDSGAQGRP
jgi:polyisoprenyl-phosphate glycosyltransferase